MMISQSPLEKKCYGSTVWELNCLRAALCESIRYQAKTEQNVRQNLIPRVRHGEYFMSQAMFNPSHDAVIGVAKCARYVEDKALFVYFHKTNLQK